jgi:hypothetical protein
MVLHLCTQKYELSNQNPELFCEQAALIISFKPWQTIPASVVKKIFHFNLLIL